MRRSTTPCLWFDHNAEAVNHYLSIFKNPKIFGVTRYGKAGQEIHGRPAGSVMTIAFELDGQPYPALNGGPYFKFTEAIWFPINWQTQEEVDYYWEKLSQDGDEKTQQCGWVKDKFGLSWQIVPIALQEMLQDADGEKTNRVLEVLLPMKKLDIAVLRRAYEKA